MTMVKGARELDRLYSNMGTKIAKGVPKIIKKNTFKAKSQWQRRIREMRAIRTGAYVQSISKELSPDGLAGTVFSGLVNGKSIYYFPYIEYGTIRMAKRPAFTLTVNDIEKKVEKDIEDLLSEMFNL